LKSKIKISVVSYLNSSPFIWGLRNSEFIAEHAVISLDIPSVCAQKLLTNQVDIGLIPSAIIPTLPNKEIVSEYCIASKEKVRSVILFSQVPLNQIKTILLDFHSRTSVTLVRILAENFWQINPQWVNAQEGFINEIKDETAAVVIGDRVFEIEEKFKYQYDLGREWMSFTGLPFVFACWVSNKKISPGFIAEFNKALENGLNNFDKVIAEFETPANKSYLSDYLKNNIYYHLDHARNQSLRLFHNLIVSKGLIKAISADNNKESNR